MKKALAWSVVGLYVASLFGGLFVVPIVYFGWAGLIPVLATLGVAAIIAWAVCEVLS